MKLMMFLIVFGMVVFVSMPATDKSVSTTEEEQVAVLVPEYIMFRSSDYQVITKKYDNLWVAIERNTCVEESARVSKAENFADDCYASTKQDVDVFLIGRAELGKYLV